MFTALKSFHTADAARVDLAPTKTPRHKRETPILEATKPDRADRCHRHPAAGATGAKLAVFDGDANSC